MADYISQLVPQTSGRLISTAQFFAFPQYQIVGYENVGLAVGVILSGLSAELNLPGNAGDLLNGLAQAWGNFTSMGEIFNLKRDQKRENKRIYGLGKYSFEPRMVVPGRITTSLLFEKVLLYKPETIGWLGFCSQHLLYQYFPFVIYEFLPDINRSVSGSITNLANNNISIPNDIHIFYTDCWFDSNPLDIDLDADNQLITQNYNVTCGKVIVIDPSIGTVNALTNLAVDATNELLPNGIKF